MELKSELLALARERQLYYTGYGTSIEEGLLREFRDFCKKQKQGIDLE